ncbi:MAG: glycosyltransferase [Candidatus Moraniibacteriota bacterium]
MRVLLINKFHYLKGGAERAYFDTAHILAENGHSVAFFAMEHPDNFETPWSRFFVSNVDYHDAAAGLWSKLRAALRILWNHEAATKLDALIEEFKPEVAHLHNTYHQLSPSILWTLRKHGVRIVMTLHDYKLISPNYSLLVRGRIWDHTSGLRAIIDRAVQDSYLKSLVCAMEKWFHVMIGSYRNVDAYIAPSRFLIEKFHAAGFPYPITHVVQPIQPFPTAPVPAVRKYLLFIGRLSKEKGLATLIEASRLLSGAEPLKIIGTGPEEMLLREQVKGIPNIEFLGYQTGEVWERALREASALVIPSIWYENMPYVVLEALSRGTPVIASNLGGVPERIQEGENGFLFEPGNTEDLVRAIRTLIEYPDPVTLSKRAYESVADVRPEAYYQTILRLYKGVNL